MVKDEAKKQVHVANRSPLINLAARFSIDPAKLLDVLRGTVIKPAKNGRPATNEEIAAFCIVADQYGLSPFTREIHAFSSGDKGIVPIVGIDGWTHIVNSTGKFNGCEFIDEAAPDGRPISVTCKMHVKERDHPVCATERYSECHRNTPPWNQMPWRMLRHKAFMQAARYAFSLAGIYDEDEARDIVSGVQTREPVPMPRAMDDPLPPTPEGAIVHDDGEVEESGAQAEHQPGPRITGNATADQIAEINRQIVRTGFSTKRVRGMANVKSLDDLTAAGADALLLELKAEPTSRQPGEEG